MATKLTIEEEGSSEVKMKLDNWKFPKIPANQVYKNSILRISQSYVVKDFEETITVSSNQQNVSLTLLSRGFLEGFVQKQHNFVHLGLVQIAVKPLLREGLGAPIVVCLRDVRHLNFQNSLLALVEPDLSEGPFYFNCFPSFSVSLTDTSSFEVLIMSRGIPLAFTYRLVCKAMVDLTPEALQKPILNETPYFQPATGTCKTTKWDEYELHVHEPSADEQEPENQCEKDTINPLLDGPILKKGKSIAAKLLKGGGGSSQIETNLEGWKYPKIPADKVYISNNTTTLNIKALLGFTSFWSKAKNRKSKNDPRDSVKELEKTTTLNTNKQNVTIKLLESLVSKQSNKCMHLGLVQVEIKPLLRDGLEAPIIVGLRDTRFLDFKMSFRAIVETDASQGPFYFNHFPGHSIYLGDEVSVTSDVLKLHVMTSGIPLALTYRVVCQIPSSFDCFVVRNEECKPGETSYFHPRTGTQATTIWEDVQVPESWKLM